MTSSKEYSYFYLLSIFHVGSVLIGMTLTARMILISTKHPFYITGGIFFIPVVFFIQDIVTEVYGYYNARKMLHATLIVFVLYVFSLYFIDLISFPQNISAFQGLPLIIETLPKHAFSFVLSLAVGGTLNNYILTKLKLAFNSRFLAMRFISSTAIGEAIFQFIAVALSWYGTYSIKEILPLAVASYVYKLLFEILATPLNIKICHYLKFSKNQESIHAI